VDAPEIGRHSAPIVVRGPDFASDVDPAFLPQVYNSMDVTPIGRRTQSLQERR
jgi:hypothetical protein